MLKFSIVTPSFNQADFIERTIESVLQQDWPATEHIVIDGGSNDHTSSILERYSDRLASWVSEPDRGQSHAVNKGVARATGDVVGWINSDDVYLPGAFRAVAAHFAEHPNVDGVYGGLAVIDADDRVIDAYWPPKPDVRLTVAVGLDIYGQALFIKREAWNRIGGIDESLHMAMDYDFITRLLLDARLSRMKRYLGALRMHGATKTAGAKRSDATSSSRREIEQLRARYGARAGLSSDSRLVIRLLRASRVARQVREAGLGYLGFKLSQRFGVPVPSLAGLPRRLRPSAER